MSDLLNSASLVMIPSGYAEDKVYSAVPTDGSGDLSFTRASNGTRVNSAGLVEVTPWNILTYSEQFDNAAWDKFEVTITANATTSPSGTLTADKFIPSIVADGHTILQSIVGSPQSFSVYAKAAEYSTIILLFTVHNARATFNLSNGTITETDGTVIASIENVGNGWYRCAISTTLTTHNQARIYAVNGSTWADRNIAGNGTSGLFIYGAQLNIGATAKPYFPTTDRLNVPRLTYQNGGGGCPSLLLEKQSTNLANYSEQFDNAYWTKAEATLTANATTSPDGTQNADSLIPSTTNSGAHVIFQSVSNSIATATYSMYIKPNGYNRVAFRENSSTGAAIGFDLLNQTIITTYSTGGCTASNGVIQDVGNGWYRISGVFSFASATSQNLALYIVSSSWTSGDPTSVAWSGNGTSGIYIWGAQVETSSYPTSYIPTTSASATRVADACSKTGISSLIGQTEGVMFVDINTPTNIPSGTEILPISIFPSGGGTGGVQAYVAFLSNGVVRFVYYDGSIQALITTASSFWSAGNRYKLAAAYKQNDFAFYINGVQIGTDNSGNVSAMADLYLDYQGLVQQNTVNQAILFPTRLTNAELASLTTI